MSAPAQSKASAVRYLEIDDTRAGQRLDNFLLAVLKGVPKSHVYRLLRKGEVRVNKGRAKPDYRLQAGDSVRLPPVRTRPEPDRARATAPPPWLAERILYEDEHLMVLDKPAGLAVHAGSGVQSGLIEILRAARPEAGMLELAHRLDRDTSGCLLLAKSRAALTALHRMLREGEIRKHYLALVKGRWQGGPRQITEALERTASRVRTAEDSEAPGGKAAASWFRPVRGYDSATLMEVELLTGRTHQARVHAAHAGHPIAGDDKYGDWDFNRALRQSGLKRVFLHAARLELRHPVTGSKLQLEAPLPPDLTGVLDRIRA
jgi:23S rRNA pseudouridine955/2504/2580 synthase